MKGGDLFVFIGRLFHNLLFKCRNAVKKSMLLRYAIGRILDLRFIGGRFDAWPGHRRIGP